MSSGDEAAPAPGTEEKLAQRERDDGRPARRTLGSLIGLAGYQRESAEGGFQFVVSARAMNTRTFWGSRSDRVTSQSAEMEYIRSQSEAPPRGSQWEEP